MKLTIAGVKKQTSKAGKTFWIATAEGGEEYFVWDKEVANKLSIGGRFEVGVDDSKPEYPRITGVEEEGGDELFPSPAVKAPPPPPKGNGHSPDVDRRIVRQTCLKVAGEIVAATVPKFPMEERERNNLFKVIADLTRGLAAGLEKWVYREEAEPPK